MGATSVTLDADHVFKVRNEIEKVPSRVSVTGLPTHSGTTSAHECQGMPRQTYSIAVPCHTLLKKPNKDDCCKLKRMLKYLKLT